MTISSPKIKSKSLSIESTSVESITIGAQVNSINNVKLRRSSYSTAQFVTADDTTSDGIFSNKYAIILGQVPVGTIVAWNPGYFTNSSNSGYNFVLPAANTIAAANTYLNPMGWYVCNGAAVNVANSLIFNAASRYLPYLTDQRFLMGFTSVGSSGSSNTHTHTVSGHYHDTQGLGATINITSSGPHSHTYSQASSDSTLGTVGTGAYNISTTVSTSSDSHTHLHASFNGYVGKVTGGSNGDSNITSSSTSHLPQYLSTLYIIRVY